MLDLVPVGTGTEPAAALRRCTDLARLAERLGYVRYWVAEHHGMPGIASSAPEILIEHIATATERIRVGSGGIMLPNHAPLRIAEAFHTLEAFHPGRIDLGDRARARNRSRHIVGVASVRCGSVRVAAHGVDRPVAGHVSRQTIHSTRCGSSPRASCCRRSGCSARAGRARASPDRSDSATRSRATSVRARPSRRSSRTEKAFTPRLSSHSRTSSLGCQSSARQTDAEADYLARTSSIWVWVRYQSGEFAALPSPEEATAYQYNAQERSIVHRRTGRGIIVGSPETVAAQIRALAASTGADEIMVTTMIHDHAARLRSYELLAGAMSVSGSDSLTRDRLC